VEDFSGRMLGRYQVEALIAHGGMAAVYRATDPSFGRTVAIKVIKPEMADDEQFIRRFLREARSIARLQHPHILPVYDVGQHDGSVYLVMQYVDGGTLGDRLHRRDQARMTPDEALKLLRPIGDALDYAHEQGVIHRDVKPSNILLTRQHFPLLMDFGIAKVEEIGTAAHTKPGTMLGTPEYMSPEQAQGMPLDGRSDLYSLAVVLYEAVTGRPPFRAETPADTPVSIVVRHLTVPPPTPRAINPNVSPAVEAVLLRSLAKRPEQRYPTGAALFAALAEAIKAPAPAVHLPDTFVDTRTVAGQGTPPPSVSYPPLSVPPSNLNYPVIGTPPPNTGYPVAQTPNSGYLPTGTPPPGGQPVTPWPAAGQYGQPGTPPPASGQYYAPVGTPPPASGQYYASPGTPPPAASPPSNTRTLQVIAGALVAVLIALVALSAIILFNGRRNAIDTVPTPGAGNAVNVPAATATAPPPTTAAQNPASTPTPEATSTVAPTATVAVAAASPTRSFVTADGRREVIMFSSHRPPETHNSEIFIMDPDGTNQRQFVATNGHSWGPRISPDGKQIVFSSVAPGEHTDHTASGGGLNGSGNHQIYLMNADASNLKNLTNYPAWNNAWSWSPDGQWIAFSTSRDGNWELYKMALKDGKLVRLTNDPGQDGWPSWTPDGKSIIFTSDRGNSGRSQLFIMDDNGGSPHRLLTTQTDDSLPMISPDGKQIVYRSGQDANATETQIYLVNIDGTNPHRITNSVAANSAPSWSPDGTQIVYFSNQDGANNIYVMNADGGNALRLTNVGDNETPFWGYLYVGKQSGAARTAAYAPDRVADRPRGWVG
jgi:serine/threonine protein kinase/Tol biopolymer transport system component